MSTQSMPWMKFAHREYMVSISRASLKPIERLAFLELAMYANTQPNRQLPDNDAALAGWAGMSLNNWLKMKDRVLSEWINTGGFWQQPNWMDLYSENAATDEASVKTKSRAEIQKEYRARNKGKDDFSIPLPTVTDSVTDSGNAALPTVTDSGNAALPNGGIKGGDLDQDSDLDLESKQKHTSAEPSAARVSAFKTELSEVFEHWKFVFKKNSATKLDDKRKTKIVARLKDGYTVDQIKQAINGCAASEYHVQNHHTDIELICRDAVHTDRFIGMSPVAKNPSPPKPLSGAVNQNFPESRITIPPTAETIAAIKKMQDELEC